MIEDEELLLNENKDIPLIIKIYKRISFRIEFYHKVNYNITNIIKIYKVTETKSTLKYWLVHSV